MATMHPCVPTGANLVVGPSALHPVASGYAKATEVALHDVEAVWRKLLGQQRRQPHWVLWQLPWRCWGQVLEEEGLPGQGGGGAEGEWAGGLTPV